MRRHPLLIILCLLGLLFAVPAAHAQESAGPAANPATRLDTDKAALDQIEAALTRTDLTDASLQKLRTQLDPVALDIQSTLAEITPRADAAKARLAQLGPKPDPKAPAEPADVTTERTAQDKLFNDLDATVKRAKVLAVQAAQIDTTIGSLRRGLFTRSVLARSYSLIDPRLWIPVVNELPADFRAIRYLGSDWYDATASRIEIWQLAIVVALLVIVAAGLEPVQRLGRRVSSRDAAVAAPSALRKVWAGIWVAIVTAVVPIVAALLIGAVLYGFDLVNGRLEPLVTALWRGVIVISINVGLARGFFSPRRPTWRLPPVSDVAAVRLSNLLISVTALVQLSRFVEALNDTISVGLNTAIATRGLIAAVAVVVIIVTLERLGLVAGDGDEEAQKPAPRKGRRDWTGPLRVVSWLLIATLVGALLIGFVAFAAFLLTQIIVVCALGILLFLLVTLSDEGIETGFQPNRVFGRALSQSMGLRRDSLELIGIMLSGALRVLLVAIAILLALAPWRIESGDMLSTVQAAFFGFSIGELTISPSSIVIAAVLFAAAIAATRAVQRWLEVRFLPRTRLDSGLQNSIRTSLGYLGFLLAASLALSQLGLSFERLAIVAGALSVGIGFGLQSIVNNFVSGLILLWERAVRVGDWVVVGSDQGYVRRINVRSTEIETFDRATVIVPNSNLVSGVVKNLLRNGHTGRIMLPFTLPVGLDPEAVRKVLIDAAKDHEKVLKIPTPQVFFVSMDAANMQFDLMCFVDEVEAAKRVTSDLLFTIVGGLRDLGVGAPAPLPQVTSPALDKLDAWLSAKMTDAAAPQSQQA